MTYRKEIDGLRAVAVLSVIFFHAGLAAFPGGYVGVDIFFVISGYLISGIILEERDRGRFSMTDFYARRIRRIAPALLVVCATCIPFAWFWMLPGQHKEFLGGLFSISVFLSNFYFLSQLEYFQPTSELQPLLHTWSLSIEEQFYLIFPAAALLFLRLGKRLSLVLLVAFIVIGIWAAMTGPTADPSKNYFHSAGRLWEIAVGVACTALARAGWSKPNDLLAAFGLALIAAAVFFLDSGTRFPGSATLLPILGTALIVLYAKGSSRVAKMLGWGPLVAIGLVSYSAYLWHQPLFAFMKLRFSDQLSSLDVVGLVVFTFVLAGLSWRFVERPFRMRSTERSRPLMPLLLLMAMLSVGAYGLVGYMKNGFDRHLSGAISLDEIEYRLRPNWGLGEQCDAWALDTEECRTIDRPNVLLWGDSFGMHVVGAVMLANPGIALQQATRSGCSPVMGMVFGNANQGIAAVSSCFENNNRVSDWIEAHPDLKHVVLSASFPVGDRPVWAEDGDLYEGEAAFDIASNALRKTIVDLKARGLAVTIVSPTPEMNIDLGQCLSRVLRFELAEDLCDFDINERKNNGAFRLVKSISDIAPVIWLDTAICPNGTCDTLRDGVFIYRDMGHLSVESAQIFRNVLGGLFRAQN